MSKQLKKVRRWDSIDDVARDAYEAYAQALRDTGATMPTWKELQARTRQAWATGQCVVLAKAHRIIVEDMQAELVKSVQDNCRNLGIEIE